MKSTIDIPKIQQRTFKISGICDVIKGNIPTMKAVPGKYPLVVTAENRKTCENYQFDSEAVCIPLVSSTGHGHADIKRIHYQNGKFALANIMVAIVPKDDKTISTKYLYYLLNTKKDEILVSLMRGTANVTLKIPQIENIMISLPSVNEQKMIISKIEKFYKEFISTKQVLQELTINLEHYKQSFLSYILVGKQHERLDNSKMSQEYIQIPKGWEKTSVGKEIELAYGKNLPKLERIAGDYPVYGSNGIVGSHNKFLVDFPSIVIGRKGTIGSVHKANAKFWPTDVSLYVKINDAKKLQLDFVYYLLLYLNLPKYKQSGPKSGLNRNDVYKIEFIRPPLSVQKKIIQKFDQAFSLTEYSKNIIKSQFSLLETMRDSLFKKYFQES